MKTSMPCRIAVSVITLLYCATAACLAQEPGSNVWTFQDIGSPGLTGSSSNNSKPAQNPTSFAVVGTGSYSGTSDTGQFYYQPLTGDGSLVAKVAAITGTVPAAASAGVMIRASMAPESQEMYINLTGSAGQNCVVRTTTGGAATVANVSTNIIPYYVKVVRSGASFSGYTSASGTTWTQIGTTATMNLPDTVYIGMAVASSNTTSQVTGTFTNVTLSQSNSLGNGVGLYGEYFSTGNLTYRNLTRLDPTINFNWTGTTPAPAITTSTFSARWTGTVTPRYSETYTFNATFNGGVNVWVYPLPVPAAGEATSPIISNTGAANGNASGQVAMVTGSTYRIEVDYTTARQSNPGVTLSWSSANQTSEVVPMQQLVPAYAGKGRILDEQWLNMTERGVYTVADLTSLATYPLQPTGRHFLTSIDMGNNVCPSYYGSKMCGYIYPPETGNYNFWIAAGSEAQFWLSASESPSNLTEICNIPVGDYTTYLQWNKYSNQKSANVYLYASQRYYFEVLSSYGSGTDNDCAVGWATPSGISERPIVGERVSPYEAVTAVPSQSTMFNTLATGHPRLFTDAQGFTNLTALALTGSTQQNLWYVGLGGTAATTTSLGNPVSGSFLSAANALFALQPTAATSGQGGDNGVSDELAAISQIEGRVGILGMAYELSGNPDYLNRAWEELDCAGGVTVTPNTGLGDTWTGSVTGWTTWGASTDDLSNSEIMSAYAVGYDWLYNGLSTAQISFMEAAIAKAMNIQLANYEAGPGAAITGVVYYGTGNHTDVDFGSTCLGALAIANDPQTSSTDTTTCAAALSYALASTTYGCLSILGPDGCDPESPDYHMFLTTYLGYGFSALEAANAGDMGLTQQPGQTKLGGYQVGVTGPNSTYTNPSMFNYNDCWDVCDLQWSPAEFWYGWKFDQCMDAWSELQTAATSGEVSPFDLLWYDSRATGQHAGLAAASPLNVGQPLDTMYRTSDIMTFRTSYSKPSDSYGLFAAIKGGDTTTGHAHNSQGTFLVQAYGIEWASLLGFDSYGLSQYFCDDPNYNPNRWQYYRCRAEGANTLVIGPCPNDNGGRPDQNPGYTGSNGAPVSTPNSTGQSKVVKFSSTPTVGETILNMTAIYPNSTQTLRGLQLNRPTGATPYVLIQDEISVSSTMSIYWFMHYKYQVDSIRITDTIQSGSTTALETCNGQTMFLKILSPAGAYFYDTTATPLPTSPAPAYQNSNSGASYYWRKLAINYNIPAAGTTTLCVEMVPGGDPGSYPTVVPLKNW